MLVLYSKTENIKLYTTSSECWQNEMIQDFRKRPNLGQVTLRRSKDVKSGVTTEELRICKMSSQSGRRPQGTDGTDFSHRQRVAPQYQSRWVCALLEFNSYPSVEIYSRCVDEVKTKVYYDFTYITYSHIVS
ncbi:hypothetical protein GQR58_020931 [Nymphon striatum]|nr:hypothetical protein GQR58_020931 [Nymphon striatum]